MVSTQVAGRTSNPPCETSPALAEQCGYSAARSSDLMSTSFLLSNMTPQRHGLNAGRWENLESAVRDLARSRGTVWIFSGPIFRSDEHFVSPLEYDSTTAWSQRRSLGEPRIRRARPRPLSRNSVDIQRPDLPI